MKLVAHGAGAKRAVFEALLHLPADVRAFALQRVGFLMFDPNEANGYMISMDALAGAEWLVVVGVRSGMVDTLGHEIAHCMLGHRDGSAEDERQAAQLARDWGFTGTSADPEERAGAFVPWSHRRRAVVTTAGVAFECSTCGAACQVVSPTAAGLPAEVGVECSRCRTFDILVVAGLVPCDCGARAAVMWAEAATPEVPVGVWTCSCGATATRTIRSATAPQSASDLIVPGDEEPAWRYFLRAAQRVLAMERGDPAWARRQLRRALAEMDGDPRREGVQAALDALVEGEVATAIDAVSNSLDGAGRG